ncbi:BTAD domain-containing putative transcriptional regulator [Amycolatopsis sp. NPDC059090]|uniref:BTAD domain-containing putative transcriptional regulator n=1 Tax=Amycolatopsis sp. NPDC059090 TaxID=3346723 RepID=UPI0036704AF6
MSGKSQPALRVQLLGPVRAWLDDHELDLGGARQRLVFTILALGVGHPVSREELVDGVWGENPPTKAGGILHTYIWGLRQVLEPGRRKEDPPEVLISPSLGYALRLSADQLDAQRFARFQDSAQRRLQHGELQSAIREFQAALSLWQGEALAGLTGAVVDLHRTRLVESRLAALERLAEAKILVGDNEGAIDGLHGLVADHPLREKPLALLMTALYRAGRRDEALVAYSCAAHLLDVELGIEPAPAVQQVRAQILDGEPISLPSRGAVRATGTTDSGPGLPVSAPSLALPALIGRKAELAWLRSLADGLEDGRGGCGWIEGVPGIGKSALLAAGFAGRRVVWITGEEMVRHTVPDRSSTPDPRVAGVDRTLALVEQMCAEGPTVVVVDDLQGADQAGELLWRRLTRLTQRVPLVLVGACRTFPRTAGLELSRDAVSAAGGQATVLGPLTADDVSELAARQLGAPAPAALREYLDETLGNPLYVKELLDTFSRVGTPESGTEVLETGDRLRSELRAALAGTIVHRLGFLTPATREMLGWAALLGTRFDLGDAAAVVRSSPADLIPAVEEATAMGLLVDTDRGLDFASDSVRRALYENQDPAVRVARHRTAAETLASSGAPVEQVAAQLLGAAPEFDPWVVRWLLANTDAVGARDPFLTVDLLERVMIAKGIGDEDRERLAVHRARWLFYLGRRPEAEARAVLSTTTDAEHAAEMRWIVSQLIHDGGQVRTALTDLEDAERNPEVPDFWKARYRSLRARFERTGLDDLETASRTALAVLDQLSGPADPVALSEACQELWYVETVRRDHGAALAHVDRALAATTGVPNLARWQLHLLDNRAFSLQNLDRLDEASEALARMRALSNHVRPRASRHHVATAVHCYWLGRWDEALAELDLLEKSAHRAEFFDLRPQTPLLQCGIAAIIAAQRGDEAALRKYLKAAAAHPILTLGDMENSDFSVVARAIDAGRIGGPDAELAELDVLLDLDYGHTTLRHQWTPMIVRLALAAGDRARVKTALDVSEAEAVRETPPTRANSALTWCRGLVGDDPSALLAIAHRFGDVGRPVEMAAALTDTAAALARHREGERAHRTFGKALMMLTELGAAAEIDRAVRRMDDLGVRLHDVTDSPPVTGWHSLSELERRVAELAATGTSNVEIAVELTMSRREVHSHLSRAMQKLEAGSREELAEMITAVVEPAEPSGTAEAGGR